MYGRRGYGWTESEMVTLSACHSQSVTVSLLAGKSWLECRADVSEEKSKLVAFEN